MRCFQPPADTRFYAGMDLHARSLFLVVLDRDGQAAGVRMRVGCGSSLALGREPRLPWIDKPGRRPMAFAAAAVTAERKASRERRTPVAVETVFS